MMNKKKIIRKSLIIILLIFSSVMLGSMAVSDVNVQAATKKEKKIKKEYKEFVNKNKFEKKMKKGWDNYFSDSTNIRSSYGIADIDNNGTPELIVQSIDETGWACTLLYTYNWKKKKIKNIKFPTKEETYDSLCYSYGGIQSYSKKYKCFCYKPLSNIETYATIKKGKAKSKYTVYWEHNGENWDYWVNNKKMTEKDFYKHSKSLKNIKFKSIDLNYK